MQQTKQNNRKPEHNIDKEGRNKKWKELNHLNYASGHFILREDDSPPFCTRKPISAASTPNLKVCLSSSKEELKIERDNYYDERKRKG